MKTRVAWNTLKNCLLCESKFLKRSIVFFRWLSVDYKNYLTLTCKSLCQCVKHSIVSNTTWSKRKFKQLNNIRIKQNIWGFVCFNQAVIKRKVPLDSQAKILEFLIPFIINNPYPWTFENWKTGTPGPGGVSIWFLMKIHQH